MLCLKKTVNLYLFTNLNVDGQDCIREIRGSLDA